MAKIPRLRPVLSTDDITPQKRVPELIRVPAAKALTGILVCDSPFYMPTHFDGKFTVLCPGIDTCQLHTVRALRDYYLIALCDKNSGVVSWVQLSDHAAASLMRQIRDLERGFYGTCIKVGRERPHMQAPITVSVDQWANVSGRLRDPMTPEETLERVFNSPKVNGQNRNKAV